MQTLFDFGNGRGVRPLFSGHYSLPFRCCLSKSRLATFHSEVKNRRYCVFLEYKLGSLKNRSQQNSLPPYLFKVVFGKVFCIVNARVGRGRKAILFILISHFLLSFGSLGNFKVLILDFEWFSSEAHCELETMSFKIPPFLELTNSDVTSFISDNYPTIFPTALKPCLQAGRVTLVLGLP